MCKKKVYNQFIVVYNVQEEGLQSVYSCVVEEEGLQSVYSCVQCTRRRFTISL